MNKRSWSKDSILFEMRRYAELYGEAPRCLEWEHDPCFPTPAVVRYHFGSWKAAILAAGLTPRSRGATGHRLPPVVGKRGFTSRHVTT